jgi:hypothetical protein
MAKGLSWKLGAMTKFGKHRGSAVGRIAGTGWGKNMRGDAPTVT